MVESQGDECRLSLMINIALNLERAIVQSFYFSLVDILLQFKSTYPWAIFWKGPATLRRK
jgi:hypothetical protein